MEALATLVSGCSNVLVLHKILKIPVLARAIKEA
jgi:hypothetical protein